MKYSIIISALACMASATFGPEPPKGGDKGGDLPCSSEQGYAVPSAAPVKAYSSWAAAPPKQSYPVDAYASAAPAHPPPPPEGGEDDDECPCKKKKPASSWAPAAPTGAYTPPSAVYTPPSNGSYSNYTNPSQTYTPAQQTANAGAHHGPVLTGVFGLAAALAML